MYYYYYYPSPFASHQIQTWFDQTKDEETIVGVLKGKNQYCICSVQAVTLSVWSQNGVNSYHFTQI